MIPNLFVRFEVFREYTAQVKTAFRNHYVSIRHLAEAASIIAEIVDQHHHALRTAGLIDASELCVGQRLVELQKNNTEFADVIRGAYRSEGDPGEDHC